ncbi:hypothetical protein Tco_0580604 [Tanacetum coccineum]
MDSEVVKSKKRTEESSKGAEDELEFNKSKKAESSEEKAKGSRKKMLGRKRAGKEKQQESSKKPLNEDDKETAEHEEVEEDDEAELKKNLVIVKDDEIVIDTIPFATKPPMIVEYKLLKEGIIVHFQLIRADGSSKKYSLMIRMLQDIDKEDLETLWKLVKIKHGDIRTEDEHERVAAVTTVRRIATIRRIGINKWYQSFALRNFDLEVMEFESAQTSPSTSSTNDVNTAILAYEVSTASPNVNTASPQVSTASFSDNVVYVFMVENPNGSNLLQQDLEQIREEYLEANGFEVASSVCYLEGKEILSEDRQENFH